jgi:hypothetical protein
MDGGHRERQCCKRDTGAGTQLQSNRSAGGSVIPTRGGIVLSAVGVDIGYSIVAVEA